MDLAVNFWCATARILRRGRYRNVQMFMQRICDAYIMRTARDNRANPIGIETHSAICAGATQLVLATFRPGFSDLGHDLYRPTKKDPID